MCKTRCSLQGFACFCMHHVVLTCLSCCAVYMGQAARDLGEVVCHVGWCSQGANGRVPKAVLQTFPGGNLFLFCVCAVIRTSPALLGPRCAHVTSVTVGCLCQMVWSPDINAHSWYRCACIFRQLNESLQNIKLQAYMLSYALVCIYLLSRPLAIRLEVGTLLCFKFGDEAEEGSHHVCWPREEPRTVNWFVFRHT